MFNMVMFFFFLPFRC